MPAASFQGSQNAYEISLGLGAWGYGNTIYYQYYLSQFKSNDNSRVDGKSVGKHEYTSNRFGVQTSGFNNSVETAGQGEIFLYNNKSDFNIDRSGLASIWGLPTTKHYH